MNTEQELEKLVDKCLEELSKASNSNYDAVQADRTASLFLMAQIKLAAYLENIEFMAKQAKNEIARIEAEKYFEVKTDAGFSDKKLTEPALNHAVAKQAAVQEVKQNCAKYEAATRKWNYLFNSLKDGHLYFRNLSKKEKV